MNKKTLIMTGAAAALASTVALAGVNQASVSAPKAQAQTQLTACCAASCCAAACSSSSCSAGCAACAGCAGDSDD